MPHTLSWMPRLLLSFTSSETSVRHGDSLQNCRLYSSLEIFLQTNQKCFLLLSQSEQLFLHKVSVHHIPSYFSNLFHVKLLSPWPSQLLPHPHYKSLSKMLWMCILMYMFFTPSFTFLPCIYEGRNYLFMLGVV